MSDQPIIPRFSHSQLTQYMSCGEQYRLERRHRLGGSVSWALIGGSAFHSWTEDLDNGEDVKPEDFIDFLNRQVESEIKSQRNPVESEDDIKPTGRKTKEWPNKRDRSWWEHHGPIFAQQYIDWREADDNVVYPLGSLGFIEFEVDGTLGGLEVKGFIDRIALDNPLGEPVIMDLKGLPLDTKIPTPEGWTTMGEIEPGDRVFDAHGDIASVTAKSNVKRIGTYRINFHDGTSMVVDSEHIVWAERGRSGAPSGVSIQEIVNEPRRKDGGPLWRVPVNAPLWGLPTADLPVNPYALGAWLGDGQKSRNVITKTPELFAEIEKEGIELGVEQPDGRSKAITRTLIGHRAKLEEAGVLGNRRIPMQYLRASYEQRLALLQGLMDTDGTVNTARRRVVFSGCDERLVRDVGELLRTLGIKALVQEGKGHGFGKDVRVWSIEFTPAHFNPFRTKSKSAKCEQHCGSKNTELSRWRTIKSVEEGPDVETQCISVDSPSRTYLATEQMIPTHNTGREPGTLLQLATYAVLASEMLDTPITKGAFYLAEKGELSQVHDLSMFTRSYIEGLYEQANRGLSNGVFLPNPNAFCSTCPVRQYCGLYGGIPPLGVPQVEPVLEIDTKENV